MLGLPHDAVGAIVAAIIAGVIALLGLVISKESKVSEFRQEWIDRLREDIAAVIAHSHTMWAESLVQHTQEQTLWSAVKPDYTAVAAATARISLRLNPKEKESRALLSAVNEIKSIFSSPNPEFHLLADRTNKLVDAANAVLKQEWRRVKFGEPVYRITRWLTAVLTVALFIALLYQVWGKPPSEPLSGDSIEIF